VRDERARVELRRGRKAQGPATGCGAGWRHPLLAWRGAGLGQQQALRGPCAVRRCGARGLGPGSSPGDAPGPRGGPGPRGPGLGPGASSRQRPTWQWGGSMTRPAAASSSRGSRRSTWPMNASRFAPSRSRTRAIASARRAACGGVAGAWARQGAAARAGGGARWELPSRARRRAAWPGRAPPPSWEKRTGGKRRPATRRAHLCGVHGLPRRAPRALCQHEAVRGGEPGAPGRGGVGGGGREREGGRGGRRRGSGVPSGRLWDMQSSKTHTAKGHRPASLSWIAPLCPACSCPTQPLPHPPLPHRVAARSSANAAAWRDSTSPNAESLSFISRMRDC
jgi:hypothetical protein